jgi:parallel beta-helix repeat protein
MPSSLIPSRACRLALILAVAIVAVPLPAQTPIGGNQSGTLAAGVYHSSADVVVPLGATWTLSPGVIIKFTNGGHELTVNGTLLVNGTSGNPVILTDDSDDTAGGDTNGNGPSSGAPAAWRGVVFNASSTGCVLNHADIRYGGGGYISNVHLNSANPTLTNCTIRNCWLEALDLNGNSFPTVTGCTFTNNAGYAIHNVPIGALPGLTNNTGSGNVVNSVHVTTGAINSNLSIGAASNMSGGILVEATLAVAAGATLTVGAGTVLKFQGGYEVTVDGTLIVNGTSGAPAIFTDDADDTAGGDTNGDGGATVPAPAAWRGIVINSGGSASTLTYADVRYGGSGYISNVHLVGSSPTLTSCTLRNCWLEALDLNNTSFPSVSGCTFTNNAGYAIHNVPIAALPAITNNTGSGNAVNSVHVTVGAVDSNLTIGPASHMSGGILLDATVAVAAGVTLTLGAGTVLKFQGGYELTVNGTLVVNGTSGAPVILTDDADDSAGGDTNGNGASAGAPASWRGIVFNPTSTGCALAYADVRYGGAGYISNVHLNSASPTLTNCTIRDCWLEGMDLNNNSFPTVTNCTFIANAGYAIQGVPLSAVPAITNNSASGNAVNSVHVTTASIGSNVTINPASNLGGAILVDATIAIAAGYTLTVNSGVVFKFQGGYEVTVDGMLLVNGSFASPVVFTDDADDSAGGDTNNDGPSSGTSAAWRGIVINSGGSGSSLTYADVRYGGSGYVSNVHLVGSSPTFTACTIRNCWLEGMDLNGGSFPTVAGCNFVNNAGAAVQNVPLAAVPGFTNNTASGNSGNYMQVVSATISTNLTIGAQSILNGALVLSTTVAVQPTGSLTLNQGVVFKFSGGHEVNVDGALHLKGTAYEPVVLTGFADDSRAGDTNNDGPSSAAPAAWRGITFAAGALPSTLENVLIRYTGSGYVPGMTSAANVTLKSVRVDHAWTHAFSLPAAAGSPSNLVAWGCLANGIHLTGGTFTLIHATAAGGAVGFRAEPAWSGSVINSISSGNASNYSGFGAGGAVSYSCGAFNGFNNNIDVDPQFTDLAGGDLRLLPTSPCVNAAEPFTAFGVQKDHDENSRILDSALTGALGADMGAFEVAAWDMNVTGVPKLNSPLTFTVNGPVGDSIYVLGLLDGVLPLPPWGLLLAGMIPNVTVIQLIPFDVPVNTPVQIWVPNDPGIVGLAAGIQTLTRLTGNPTLGNFTQLYRVTVRP